MKARKNVRVNKHIGTGASERRIWLVVITKAFAELVSRCAEGETDVSYLTTALDAKIDDVVTAWRAEHPEYAKKELSQITVADERSKEALEKMFSDDIIICVRD